MIDLISLSCTYLGSNIGLSIFVVFVDGFLLIVSDDVVPLTVTILWEDPRARCFGLSNEPLLAVVERRDFPPIWTFELFEPIELIFRDLGTPFLRFRMNCLVAAFAEKFSLSAWRDHTLETWESQLFISHWTRVIRSRKIEVTIDIFAFKLNIHRPRNKISLPCDDVAYHSGSKAFCRGLVAQG